MNNAKQILIFLSLTVGPLIIGLINTVFIEPEDVGSWQNYAGYIFLLIAVTNFTLLLKNFNRTKK